MVDLAVATQNLRGARNRAALSELLGRLTGKPTELLSNEDEGREFRASGVVTRTLRDTPLGTVVGSVGC